MTGIIENIFHKCKHPIDINNVDISKLLMSDKRWMLDTKSNDGIRPLSIKLSLNEQIFQMF